MEFKLSIHVTPVTPVDNKLKLDGLSGERETETVFLPYQLGCCLVIFIGIWPDLYGWAPFQKHCYDPIHPHIPCEKKNQSMNTLTLAHTLNRGIEWNLKKNDIGQITFNFCYSNRRIDIFDWKSTHFSWIYISYFSVARTFPCRMNLFFSPTTSRVYYFHSATNLIHLYLHFGEDGNDIICMYRGFRLFEYDDTSKRQWLVISFSCDLQNTL